MAGAARRPVIGVMGAGSCDAAVAAVAEEVGRLVAEAGAILLCGGRGGVMEAAARGAKRAGGLAIGILPGRNAAESEPNAYVDVAIFTGLNEARNWINVCSSDAILATLTAHVEGIERAHDPFFQAGHIGAHVGPPPLEVQHDIGHALAGAVIGELAAAAGGEQRKAGVEQVGLLAAGA